MAFKGLKIDISGDSGSAIASLEATKQQLRETGGAADSADDELEELGDQATTTSAQLSGLSTQASLTRGSLSSLVPSRTVSSLSQTVKKAGKLAGALGGVATVATPLISTLGGVGLAAGGLASGFGAIVGSGLIAFGQKRGEQNEERLEQIQSRIEQLETLRDETGELTDKQEEELEKLEEQADKTEELTGVTGGLKDAFGDLQDEITPLITDLGEKFIPLIEDAFDAVPTLVKRIIDGLGPLDKFKNALRDAGQTILENAKPATEAILDLGRDALPVLRDFSEFAVNNAGPAFNTLVETTKELGPVLVDAGQGVADVIPELNEFGTVLLKQVIPRIGGFVDSAGEMLGKIRDFADESGLVTFAQNATDAVDSLLETVRDTEVFQQFKTTIEADLSAVSTAISQAATGEFDNALGTLVNRASERVQEIAELIGGEGGEGGVVNDAINNLTDSLTNSETQQKLATGADKTFGAVSEAAVGVRDALIGPNGESGILRTLVDSVDRLLGEISTESVTDAFENLEEGVKDTRTGIKNSLVGGSGEGGLNETVETAFQDVNDFLSKDATSKILEEGITTAFSQAAKNAITVTNILVGDDGKGGILNTFIDGIGTFFKDSLPNISGGIGKGLGEAIRAGAKDITNVFDSGEQSDLVQTVKDLGVAVVTQIPTAIANTTLGIKNALIELFQGVVQGLVGAEEGEIQTAGADLANEVIDSITSTISGSASFVFDVRDGIANALVDAVPDSVKDFVPDGVKDIGKKIVDFIINPIEESLNIADAIKEAVTGLTNINISTDFITDPINNTVLNPLNDRLNDIKINKKVLGQRIKFDPFPTDPLPELAEGGVVTEETLARVGEGGQPEAVVPLDKADEFGGKTVNIDVRVEGGDMDERQLARDLHAEFQAQDL